MFSQHEGRGFKPRDFFGSNETIPSSVSVAGVEAHVMSSLVGVTGTASHYETPGNAHNAMSLSSRMEASASAQAAAELNRVLSLENDKADFDASAPVEGAALPSVSPAQLKQIKRAASRAVSHPGVKPKYREGDPRSPEVKALKAAAVSAASHDGQPWPPPVCTEDMSIEEYRPLASRGAGEDEKKDGSSGPAWDEDGDESDIDNSSLDYSSSATAQHELVQHEEESEEPHFKAGAGGFTEIAPGVKIANPLVSAADETEGRTLEGPPPDDLLCEECSKNTATMYSEIDRELLCQHCCDLLYLPTSGGKPHEDVRNGLVRALTGFDRDRLHSKVVNTVGDVAVTIPDCEVDEEEMAKIRGFAPDKPTAIEAPEINLVREAADKHLNRQDGKFLKGDVVVFDADSYISEMENGKFGHAAWRKKQILGIVLAVPNSRHGAYGTAHRRIAGNEMMYRVRVVRYVTGDYHKYPNHVETRGLAGGIPKGGGVKILDSSDSAVDSETGQMVKAKLVEEKSRAWRLDKEIESLELERQKAKTEYDGDIGSPGAKNRDGDWQLFLSKLPEEEESELICDEQFKDAVVLLAERSLSYPSECESELVQSRRNILRFLIEKLDWSLCEKDFRTTMTWWWHSVVMVGRANDYSNAVVVQKHVRRYQKRYLLSEMTAIRDDQIEWVKWWRIHRGFPYELDVERQKVCYNVRGTSIFLPTLAMTNRWTVLWMKMTKKMVKWMRKAVNDSYMKSMTKWKAAVTAFKNFEEQQLREAQEEEERLLLENKRKVALSETLDASQKKPWHPCVGIVNIKGQLTPLPQIYCKYSASGSLVVEDFPKYNSFRNNQGGPTDTSAWVIPGQLLFGSYPDGKARSKGRQPQHSDSLAQILMSGVGSFINLMEEEEEHAFEIRKGDHLAGQDIAEKLRRRFMFLRSQLMSAVQKCQRSVQQENIEVAAMPRYIQSDSRYEEAMINLHEAVARQGLAIKQLERAKADLNHFAKEFVFERYPIKEGNIVENTENLVSFCENIEKRLREGEKFYIFDRLGHGRVGILGAILLGRIYGCTAEEALFRIQMYHDSKVSVQLSNRSYSCPQTVDQVAQVRQVLSLDAGMYSSLVMKSEDATITFEVKRRIGLPKLKKGKLEVIDHEKIWDEQIGDELEMDDEELEESITSSRHHCNATPGHGVVWKEPEYEYKLKGAVPIVDKPTMMSLVPLTTLEELEEREQHIEVLRRPLVEKDGSIEVIPKNRVPASKKKREAK